MKIRKNIILAVSLMLLGAIDNSFALDLSQFKAYMSGNRGKAAVQEQKQSNKLPEEPTNNFRDLNADAYYVTSKEDQFIPLGNSQNKKDGERYLIPEDTPVPKELKPLLVEERTHRQGLA
ncbi:MAG: hypothetical protein IKP71_12560, partial [Candidatus Riflebacteria bacterium]|nr:hypothetical protein [Candidatus Riflebacteria bacterium]